MRNAHALAALSFCLAILACGSSDKINAASTTSATDGNAVTGTTTSKSGTASTSGSVEGHSLAPQWAAFAANADAKNSIFVVLSSQASYCSNVTSGITTPNHISIGLGLSTVASDATTPAPTPGTYPIVASAPSGAGNRAVAAFNVSNATCASALTQSDGSASSGSVTLTAVSSTQVAGSFTMTVDGETVTGAFDAVPCAGLAAEIKSGASLTCQAN